MRILDPEKLADKIGVNLPESYLQLFSKNDSFNGFENDDIEYGWKNVIVFGKSANGNYLGFDYRYTNCEPPIILMLRCDLDEDGRMTTVNIAENYEKFMDLV